MGFTLDTKTQRKRIQLVLDPPIYEAVKHKAAHHNISLSMAVRDLIKEALEWEATREVYSSPELLLNLKKGLGDEVHGRILKERKK